MDEDKPDSQENQEEDPPAGQAYESPDIDRAASAMPTESDLESEIPGGSAQRGHDPYAALRNPNYRYYTSGNIVSIIGSQMVAYLVGYQLYKLTNSTTALGLVGLVQVFPILMLTLLAGSVIDRFNRKVIILIDQGLMTLSALSLGFVSLLQDRIPHMAIIDSANAELARLATMCGEHAHGEHAFHFDNRMVPPMYGLLFINGAIRSFNQPAKQSLLPHLVPPEMFANAVTWNSSIFETCTMIGPMLAGALVAMIIQVSTDKLAFATIYFINSACQLTMLLVFLPIKLAKKTRPREPLTMHSLLAGIRFVRNTKVIFASMTLDMFAVLFGGATALLPVMADRVLHVGPVGLGMLRSAPSVGAILMALIVAHLPPMKRPGLALLWAVVGFGVATVTFGLSTSFALSLVALFFTGVCDNISVVTRHSMVQILTPDAMRGRVSAVNSLFISSSNEIGELESGLTASAADRWLGPIVGPKVAIVAGGIGSLLVVLGINAKWPQIRRLGPLAGLRREEEAMEHGVQRPPAAASS